MLAGSGPKGSFGKENSGTRVEVDMIRVLKRLRDAWWM